MRHPQTIFKWFMMLSEQIVQYMIAFSKLFVLFFLYFFHGKLKFRGKFKNAVFPISCLILSPWSPEFERLFLLQIYKRMKWLNCIMDSMDMSLTKLQQTLKDREDWHAVVHVVSKSRTWLSDWTTTTEEEKEKGLIKYLKRS